MKIGCVKASHDATRRLVAQFLTILDGWRQSSEFFL